MLWEISEVDTKILTPMSLVSPEDKETLFISAFFIKIIIHSNTIR